MNRYKQIVMATVLLGLNSFLIAEENNLAQASGETGLGQIVQESNGMQSSQDNGMRQEKNAKPMTPSPYLGDKMPPYNNPNRFMVDASFIYWQADVDGLDYALSQDYNQTINPITEVGVDAVKFQDRRLDFKWDPGFKVGIGAIFGQSDEWDLFLNWTWLRSKASNSFEMDATPSILVGDVGFGAFLPLGGFTTPSIGSPFLYGPVLGGKANWKLQYNTIDLELGRNFFLAKNFTFRPIIGVRAAWLHQHTKVTYEVVPLNLYLPTADPNVNVLNGQIAPLPYAGNIFVPAVLFTGDREIAAKNNYSGVGLRAGFDMSWNFTDHFCAYSTFSGSVLYGVFNIDEKFSDFNANVTPSDPLADFELTTLAAFNDKYHRTRTNVQVLLGLMWHTGFNNDKQHLSIGASYEVNEWFQQNELRSFQLNQGATLHEGEGPNSNIVVPYYSITDSRTSGDLGLHGVNLDVKFDF